MMSLFNCLKHDDESEKIKLSPVNNKNDKRPIVWDEKDNNQDVRQKSYEDVLKRRKERFGEVSPPKPKYQKANRQISNISTININDLNVLKKRSERFGESVSILMKKIEEKDKMRKRQARFSNRMVTSFPTSPDKQLNVEVFQHAPSPSIELFKTIDQIDAEERRKIKFEM